MSFGTSNKFAVLQVQQPKQPKPKGDKEINAAPGPKVEKSAVKDEVVSKPKENDNRGKSERGRGGSRGGRGRGVNRGGRGGNSERPPRTDQPPKNRNKREFDRLSTVPKNEIKKSNHGTGNWGTEKEEARGAEDAEKELDTVTVTEEVKVEEPVVVEPVDTTITLKEFQQQRAALAPKIELPKRREAGEGEKSDLHKYVVLKRDEDDDFKHLNIKIKEKKDRKKNQNKKQTVVLDLGVNSEDSNRRSGKKPYNNNNRKPKKNVNLAVEDHDNFPALGGKVETPVAKK